MLASSFCTPIMRSLLKPSFLSSVTVQASFFSSTGVKSLSERQRELKEKQRELDKEKRAAQRLRERNARLKAKEAAKKAELKAKEDAKPKPPTRVRVPFAFYFQKNFASVRASLPADAHISGVMKSAKERFVSLSEEEKKEYQALFEADRQRFQQERAAYLAKLPKRPLTAYAQFVKDRMPALRAEQPGAKIVDLIKTVAAEWYNQKKAQTGPKL